MMRKNTNAFTLIEVLLGIMIVTIVMTSWFQALNAVGVWKVKLLERTHIEKQAFYVSEKFFEMIKKWWTIDYEEYWNRKVVDTTSFEAWHYAVQTGFWNFGNAGQIGTTDYGDPFYYCVSKHTSSMPSGGCLEDFNSNQDASILHQNYAWQPQRYGQYREHFIDRNSDKDTDFGDENADGDILWDDDDLFLWEWPFALDTQEVPELYLMSNDGKQRTLFRLKVREDPEKPSFASCDFTDPQKPQGDGCLGTIEFLKLTGSDEGFSHMNDSGIWDNDGVVDTWRIDRDFSDGSEVVAGSSAQEYWQKIFPDTVHVRELSFFVYPQKDHTLAWKDDQSAVQVHPHIAVHMTLEPSWKVKKKLKWTSPQTHIRTHISLLSHDIQ